MKIRRLELCGFKSFKDRTVINFHDGITGIVGPNGCGKSNIVDALVWVMGEQSSKHLRGTSMEDVIFGGSQNFAPSGMSEVSLTMENDGGPFPAKWAKHSEVMVTRRLHRSGESEYFINKEPSRLKDIVDIFMDTGAGSRGFSIVEQGQIGRIVTAKPQDRRTLIEEAAGITKFKVRKRESQRKLTSTEQNLYRLNDIVGELKRQLDSLQRQAKRAERYRELKNQAQDLDLWISSTKFLEMKQELDTIMSELETRSSAESEGQAKYSAIMTELQELKLGVLELEQKVTASQGRHFELQSSVQKKETDIQLLEAEIESTKRNEELAGTLRTEVEARKDVLTRDIEQTKEQMESARSTVEQLKTVSDEKTEVSNRQAAKARELDDLLTENRRELMTVNQGLTGVQVRETSLTTQKEDVERRHQDSVLVGEELGRKKSEFEDHRTKSFSALEQERQLQLSIMADVENFEENLQTLKAQEEEKRTEVEKFKDELNQVMSRLYGLENLTNNFEGLKDGVKQIMTWQRERYQPLAGGGFELVADVVEVPKDYEMAMEAALGERLQSVIAPSSDGAMTAVGLLKESQAGRSSFVNPDFINQIGSPEAEGLKDEAGVRGYLKDIVKCPEKHQRTLAHIFTSVVVVEDLHTALRLRGQFSKHTFVTLDGDVLGQDGTLTGGSTQGGDAGLLKQKREIKELSLQKEELNGKLALTQAALEKLQEQVQTVSSDLETAQKKNFEQEMLILEKKKDLERAEGELNNVLDAIARQDKDIEGLASQVASFTEQLQQAQETRIELSERQEKLDAITSEQKAQLDETRNSLDQLAQEATDAQVQTATKQQELSSLEEQCLKMETSLEDAISQLNRMSEDSTKNTESIEDCARRLEEERSGLSQMINGVREAEETLKQDRDTFEVANAKVRELDEQASQIQTENNSNTQSIGELQLKQSQLEMNQNHMVEQLRERYVVELAEVAEQYANREGDLEKAEKELNDYKAKINRIGEVNLTAIQEYEELSDRYEFLTKQQADLVNSMESLRKVIDRINRICQRRFRDTFAAVNDRFKKVFPVLFGGGMAELILIEEADGGGDPGVEIMARPPGKKLQSVTLLSGGEKALTAVSLIFAIFLVKPSPFCLLDEVDAPLDDANVYRFNDLVKEMSKRSQIILVTHNKHTMTINNTLYGVTMEDPGVSKMVSVELT